MNVEKILSIIGNENTDWIKKYPNLNEIRIHCENYITLNSAQENIITDIYVDSHKFKNIISELCRKSMHTYENTIKEGYIELGNGFRAGVCGNAVTERDRNGAEYVSSVNITGVCIRIPRFIENAADELYEMIYNNGNLRSCLIYSAPGVGKTTILRALSNKLAGGNLYKQRNFTVKNVYPSYRVALIDSRCELKTENLEKSPFIDIFSGYPKALAIEIATRTMAPQVIICDEIGGCDEAEAILTAQNTGVPFIATAHASSAEMLLRRKNIKMLHDNHIFDIYARLTMRNTGAGFIIDVKKEYEI